MSSCNKSRQDDCHLFITKDTYISNDDTENKSAFPVLNVGLSELKHKNRILLEVDYAPLGDRIIDEATLCLYQTYANTNAEPNNELKLHALNVQEGWSEDTATWNQPLLSDPIGNLIAQTSASTEDSIQVCFSINDPNTLQTMTPNGFILVGDENGEAKTDRWFRASEYFNIQENIYEASSILFHPNLHVRTRSLNLASGGHSASGSARGGTSAILIGSITTGLALLALVAFFVVRRRSMYYDEESSVSSEEEPKDFVDNLGEAFGVVSSSDDEDDTMYTRDIATVYDHGDEYSSGGVEVQNYTIGEKVQNMLFGVPDEETTVSDYTYQNKWYNRRR